MLKIQSCYITINELSHLNRLYLHTYLKKNQYDCQLQYILMNQSIHLIRDFYKFSYEFNVLSLNL